MTETQTLNHEPLSIGLEEVNLHQIGKLLSQLLADQHVLYIKLRNYHWNVKGMFFAPLHALFQEQYTALDGQIDDTAERLRSLGAFAPGSMAAFLEMSRIKETDHLQGDAESMLRNLLHDHEALIRQLREDIEVVDNTYGDAGTADFLTALMEAHEKAAWMLRAHL